LARRPVNVVSFVMFVALLRVPSVTMGVGISQMASEGDESKRNALHRALDEGEYAEAERQAADWSAQVEAEHGPQSIETAQASDSLVEALLQNGKAGAPSTLALAEHVIRVKERHLGRDQVDQLDLALSLHHLGAVRTARGEFAAAVPLHQRALSIRR